MESLITDVLVIGSGIAGLSAAIRLGEARNVLVAAKGEASEGNTDIAQGGIAAAIQEEDSPFHHFQDTMNAGDHLCREEALAYLVENGPHRVEELLAWGARFDREKGRLALTREGAHSINRILHAHGDATGHEIQNTLLRRVSTLSRVSLLERTAAVDLLVSEDSCVGARCFDLRSGREFLVRARAVVMAAGGGGQLYRRTTNFETVTGDGFAMAYRAGAILEDMEFVQFHPTGFQKAGAPNFLLSEAMRGEGGLLRNSRMERFMPSYHPLAELAPRDVVSRAIFDEIRKTGAPYVLLDMTHFKATFLRKRFPNLYRRCLQQGVDMAKEPIPVAPAAHYIMGGIRSDLEGRTNVPGLFACGESACTGVHGANRLASNSLLEGLVFGQRTGSHLLESLPPGPPDADRPLPNPPAPLQMGVSPRAEAIRDQFRDLMGSHVGIIRTGESLLEALAQMSRWLEEFQGSPLFPDHQLSEMLLSGQCIAASAFARKGSRGGHFRADGPAASNEGNRHVQVRQGPEGKPLTTWTE